MCFGRELLEPNMWRACEHEATHQLGTQHYCDFHTESIVRAATERDGYVYFAVSRRRPGLVKIGYTRDPRERERALHAEFIHIEPGTLQRETQLHAAFADAWVEGEWFRADAVQSYLEAAVA